MSERRVLLAVVLAGAAAAVLAGVKAPAVGWIGALVGFGLAPGIALTRWLTPAERGAARMARAVFLSTVVSGAAATALLWAGLAPGPAGALVLAVAYVAALLALVRERAPEAAADGWDGRLLAWLVVLAAVVAAVPLLRPGGGLWSDAWFHSAVVFEIFTRGAPPGDPYFAGLPLHYVWLFQALVAVWYRTAGVAPWALAGVLNALWIVSLAGAAYAVSRRAGRTGREAFFAAVFVPLGLDALFYLWIPLKFVLAMVGVTRGWAEIHRALSLSPFTFDQVWHFTSTYGTPPAFFSKFLVMNAFGGAAAALTWTLEGVMGEVSGRARRGLFLALSVFGVWVWQPGAGLALALGGLLAGLWLLARPETATRGAVARAAVAAAAGTAAAAPLLITTVGRARVGFPLGVSPEILPILIASTAALLFGLSALPRLDTEPGPRALRTLGFGLMIASLVILLPTVNSADKLSFTFYLVPAVAAGWVLAGICGRLAARGRRPAAWALMLAILLPVNGLYVAVVLAGRDAGARKGDPKLTDWLGAHTPADAVLIDTPERMDLLVRVPRRLYYGRDTYALQWGYDAAEMSRRRRVRDVLVGEPGPGGTAIPAPPDSTLRATALANLRRFAATGIGPVYVVWRDADHPGVAPASSFMARHPEAFEPVYADSGARVYRFTESRARPPSPPPR
jgi:hypothetical protein